MKTTPEHDARVAKITFASIYPHYVNKVEKKGRTKEELHQVIEWLTGFDEKSLEALITEKATIENRESSQEMKVNRARLSFDEEVLTSTQKIALCYELFLFNQCPCPCSPMFT